MSVVIGESLLLAIGIAVSPVAIIAVVLVLTTRRARGNGPAFALGWLIGLGVLGAVVLAIVDPAGASRSGQPAAWVSWLKVALSVALVLAAVIQFRSRPRGQEQPKMPKWTGAVEKFSPGTALGAGTLLAAVNPKNLLLAAGGAAVIAQTGIGSGHQAIAYTIFAVVGTIGVAVPVGIYIAMGDRSAGLLGRLRDWMARYNTVIMSVMCLVIGIVLLADAIGSLT